MDLVSEKNQRVNNDISKSWMALPYYINELEDCLCFEKKLTELDAEEKGFLSLYCLGEEIGLACHSTDYFSIRSVCENLGESANDKDSYNHSRAVIASLACYVGMSQAFMEYSLQYQQEMYQFAPSELNGNSLFLQDGQECCLIKDALALEDARTLLIDYCVTLDKKSGSDKEIFSVKIILEKALKQVNENMIKVLMNTGFKREYWS